MIYKKFVILALFFALFSTTWSCEVDKNSQVVKCASLEEFTAAGSQPTWKKVIIGNTENVEKEILKNNIFKNVPNLENLAIYNLINEIEPMVFKQVPKLKKLHLLNNVIEELPNGIFEDLSLDTLQITDSSLKNIKPGMLDKIEAVNLEGNQINPGTVFKNTDISFINLSNNSITKLEDCAFCGMKKLKILNLHFNYLTSFDPIRILGSNSTIEGIGLAKNKITKIPKFDNAPNLLGFSVPNNSIDKIEDNSFANCPKFQLLEVSDNKLKEIPANVFPKYKDTDEHVFLVIHGNQIQCLSQELMNKIKKLRRVTINDNPWKCECLEEVIAWAKNKRAFVGCEIPIRNCVVPCTDKNNVKKTIATPVY